MPLPLMNQTGIPLLGTIAATKVSREKPKTFTQMYQDTFTNPLGYWDEYNQGQGAQFTEQAARGMAKAGRTGMLPTLQTMAHQDYMSNYLPSLRKDLAPGLQSDTTRYGTDKQYKSDIYNTDKTYQANVYGTDKQYESSIYGTDKQYESSIYNTDIEAKTAYDRIEADKYMNDLDNLTKTYDIDETTKRQIYNTFSGIYGDLSKQQRDAVLAELGIILGSNTAGNNAVADITTDTGMNTGPGPFYITTDTGGG